MIVYLLKLGKLINVTKQFEIQIINNHFYVLPIILKKGLTKQACRYLINLITMPTLALSVEWRAVFLAEIP